MNFNKNYTASYDVELAKEVGIAAASLMNKIVFLCKHTQREDGYCHISGEKAYDELGLTRDAFETARKRLISAGLITEKTTYLMNSQKRCLHFKITDSEMRESNISEMRESNISGMRESNISSIEDNNYNNIYTKKDKSISIPFSFEKLKDLIHKDFRNVEKMPEQLTEAQAADLVERFGKDRIIKTLKSLNNRRDYCNKLNSVFETLDDWMNRQKESEKGKEPVRKQVML